jgi:hypothetical protein
MVALQPQTLSLCLREMTVSRQRKRWASKMSATQIEFGLPAQGQERTFCGADVENCLNGKAVALDQHERREKAGPLKFDNLGELWVEGGWRRQAPGRMPRGIRFIYR